MARKASARAKENHSGKGYGGYGKPLQQLQSWKRQSVQSIGWTRTSIRKATWKWQIERIKQQRTREKDTTTNNMEAKEYRKHATHVSCRCGQPGKGHMANQRRAAIYNCNAGNVDTNDQTTGATMHTTTATSIITVEPCQGQQMKQQHDNCHDGAAQQHMIDCGVPSMVSKAKMRTVTIQHAKLHGHRCVCRTNHNGQQVVIPFYVCGVKQPILSVTRRWNKGSILHRMTIQGYNTTKD